MGDSACLLHGFSYASAVPNESKQGNHMHALGESISFGRFATENLSWERWSTFSHKKYVEEAESYARPGSVAQKKAFFEAHYKRIAAQRAAAALLEQENAAMAKTQEVVLNNDSDREGGELPLSPRLGSVHLGIGDVKLHDVKVEEDDREKIISETGEKGGNEVVESLVKNSSLKRPDELENRGAISASESSETSQMEKPLLKQKSGDSEEVSSVMRKRNTGLPSMKTSSSHHKTPRRIPATPAKTMTPQLKRENNLNHSRRKPNVDEKRSPPPPRSLRALLSLGSFKESDREPVFKNKRSESSGLANVFKTPAPASTKGVATPQTEIRRMKTPGPSASGRKTTAPKWQILSAACAKSLSAYRSKLQSPNVSSPFMLRTEERAAKRKQKLEEKFNAAEVQKTAQQKTLKEKAGNEFRKLSCSLCFKARPLPDFYKERETKKPPCVQPQTAVLGKSNSNKKKQGTISMPLPLPPPPPPPTCLPKNQVSRNFSKKNAPNQTKFPITHENASPNIQQ